MLKAFCSFLFFGALIVGCACDFNCFLDKQFKKVTVPTDPKNIDVCKDNQKQFDDIRSAIKECSMTKIKVDKYEAFMKDFCSENSSSRKVFEDNKDCFVKNGLSTLGVCLLETQLDIKPEDQNKPLEVVKKVCTKLDGLYNCFNNQFATACGEEAGKVTKELTSALSSYTTGVCEEANGASVNQVLYINMLLGLLFVLMTWHKN